MNTWPSKFLHLFFELQYFTMITIMDSFDLRYAILILINSLKSQSVHLAIMPFWDYCHSFNTSNNPHYYNPTTWITNMALFLLFLVLILFPFTSLELSLTCPPSLLVRFHFFNFSTRLSVLLAASLLLPSLFSGTHIPQCY